MREDYPDDFERIIHLVTCTEEDRANTAMSNVVKKHYSDQIYILMFLPNDVLDVVINTFPDDIKKASTRTGF